MIFNGLVVANIAQYAVKEAKFTKWICRNQKPALKHQLQQSNGLQRNTLSSGIGPRNYYNTVLWVQLDGLRNCFFRCFLLESNNKG